MGLQILVGRDLKASARWDIRAGKIVRSLDARSPNRSRGWITGDGRFGSSCSPLLQLPDFPMEDPRPSLVYVAVVTAPSRTGRTRAASGGRSLLIGARSWAVGAGFPRPCRRSLVARYGVDTRDSALYYRSGMPHGLPRGTVTFLFTDIEDSTRLWEEAPTDMADGLRVHDAIVRGTIERHGGYVFGIGGTASAPRSRPPPTRLPRRSNRRSSCAMTPPSTSRFAWVCTPVRRSNATGTTSAPR